MNHHEESHWDRFDEGWTMDAQRKEADWFEDEGFWEAWQPFGFGEKAIADAVVQVEKMVPLLGVGQGDAVLDLCCGVGRHTLEFARRGMRMTGVDRTQRFLDTARQRFVAAGLEGEFVKSDMREFRRPGVFHAAYNYFTSFGYFEEEAQQRRVLSNLFDSLRPGGRLLLETMGKEIITRQFKERTWEERDGVVMLTENQAVDGWRYMLSRWVFLKGSQRREFTIKLRCYSAVELCDLLGSCGFTGFQVIGDLLTGAAYDHEAKRLIVVARKPG